MPLTTYMDLVQHALDYLNASTSPEMERAARRSVQAAYQDIVNFKRWSYYMHEGRLATVAPYSTGTVVYTNSTRELTLTGGTWPTWAARGVVRFSDVYYQVSERTSSTVIKLNSASNPGEDVASTTFEIWRDCFSLPTDFQSMGQVVIVGNSMMLDYIHPNDWLQSQRIYHGGSTPSIYTITGDPDFQNGMAIRFFPFPDSAYTLAYLYQRRPRDLKILEESAGTVSTTSGSTTVTGSGTAFTSGMVGSVIRFGTTAVGDKPTGLSGAAPYHIERIITAYSSATSVTIDADPGESLSSVVYSVSDPADLEPGAMTTFLYRSIEHHCRLIRRMPTTNVDEGRYRDALILAQEADSRSFSPRLNGVTYYPQRLADMPVTF